MLDIRWKAKALILKTTVLSAGHQPARELGAGIEKILDLFRDAAKTGDASGLQEAIMDQERGNEPPPIWEPAVICGWHCKATFYRKEGKLWWLFHATRNAPRAPREKEIKDLERVLEVFGADGAHACIIGPRSSPPGHEPVPFGWWTWVNLDPLLEIHVHKDKKGKDAMRIVPMGSRPTDGYEVINLGRDAGLDG